MEWRNIITKQTVMNEATDRETERDGGWGRGIDDGGGVKRGRKMQFFILSLGIVQQHDAEVWPEKCRVI